MKATIVPTETRETATVAVPTHDGHGTEHHSSSRAKRTWQRSTLALGITGSLLLFVAFPPLAFAPAAWIAPIPWLILIRQPHLPGRRPYWKLYLAGLVFWLMAIHWLRLPHPATSLGWIALSAYLAVYVPVFVALSRIAVHRLRVPLWLTAPTVWTGLELARAHFLTGFLMAALSHTQFTVPPLIQISDLAGAYGVSFLIMLVASGLASLIPQGSIQPYGLPSQDGRMSRSSWYPSVVAAGALALVWVYGEIRLRQHPGAGEVSAATEGPRVALIQGNSLALWKHQANMQQKIMAEYVGLSLDATHRAHVEDGRPLDLIIWPETMFRTRSGVGLVSADDGVELPSTWNLTTAELRALALNELAALARRVEAGLLVGIDRRHFFREVSLEVPDRAGPTATAEVIEIPPVKSYNSAVMVDRAGQLRGIYDKVHRVMFGEYVPLADWIPFFDRIKALTGGIDAGEEFVALELGGFRFAPSICYETVIPHVICRQVRQLTNRDEAPDVLVNLTNDAWYWGSSELDLHLACGVFRAVECRTPLVIAANGGLSAVVDSCGRVVQQSPRQQTDVLLADIELDSRHSPYVMTGDWFAGICMLCCLAIVLTSCGAGNARRLRFA